MEVTIRQISSLEKVRSTDTPELPEIHSRTVLAGERFSYQISLWSQRAFYAQVEVESPLKEHIQVYRVREANMDYPMHPGVPQEDYITFTPGLMPDILVPLEEERNTILLRSRPSTIWVKLDLPKDTKPGIYPILVTFSLRTPGEKEITTMTREMTVEVVSAQMPQQQIIYTRWFYADCIADAHQVEIFSEAHWDLIEKYIAAATDVGINMILVPVHTPPLDTEIGTIRPCVQLVDIEKVGDTYRFGFAKFHRFVEICKRNGVRYYEIAHMFSQWGATCAPNILVTENGKKDYVFGWHVAADSAEYVAFLKQYIAAIAKELEAAGISENTYFHISDEPHLEHIEAYHTAAEMIRPLIGKSKTFDALSHYEFYEKGLVECPVTVVNKLKEFLPHNIPNQWTYYCCDPVSEHPNSFLAMPSYRIRILGFLLYKFNIKGFLHWGFNFYNASRSIYNINPYQTTSGDKSYPSGDAFIVYPGKDGVYPSIRGEVIFEAMQDATVCYALEQRIGREAVVAMIDEAAGFDMQVDHYPKGKEFVENLRAKMVEKLGEISRKAE